MGALAGARTFYARSRDWAATYVGNPDPVVAAANAGAFLVWGSQPLYPVYVWACVGHDAWPAFLTWLSTPFFIAAPLVARRHSVGGRALFWAAGVANTLLSTKAFGTGTAVGWFLIPCLVIAAGFFRRGEWRIAAPLAAVTALAALALPLLGPSLVDYTPAEQTSLAHLNLWSVIVLTLYLVWSAWRARRTAPGGA